ncbi:MAG: DUF1493 family protein [Alphaproteobacteria bacterium]|nr:MAG: DUF1493 family protein [Alphaproteobacteria bacterium]
MTVETSRDVYLRFITVLVQDFSIYTVEDESTRIEQDLHLRGDDLWRVLERITAEYGTDFSALEWKKFFHGEYWRLRDMFWAIQNRWFGIATTDRPEVTVGHLIDVIERGQWFDP